MSETLVVVSKLKKFIKEKAEMNCSASAIEAISKKVAEDCLRAIENAKQAKRKTVLDRDFEE
ncbi:MAG: hypothetical protein KR126chlam1_00761 [Chlamydiae bacterium]|nr:hypothetical protein [Chlamydiota bacterium]